MNAISSFSARQLRRAAEIKEEMQSLESKLNRIASSPEGDGVHVSPRRRGRLRSAVRRGIIAVTGTRLARTSGRSIILPAQRLKRKVSSAARARITAAARSRWDRMNHIDIA
ncbi:MAG TPA: hypothetical protein VMF08_03060 [Candidatus Sulfotelmatobacter sp.]|nr:hypothetical protein [Candidatus Sulfotelmatobacter sp.]